MSHLLSASLLWLDSLLEFLPLLAFCCYWGPAVVDVSFFHSVSTVVGVQYVVGLPAMADVLSVVEIPFDPGVSTVAVVPSVVDVPIVADVPSIFSIHAVVGALLLFRPLLRPYCC